MDADPRVALLAWCDETEQIAHKAAVGFHDTGGQRVRHGAKWVRASNIVYANSGQVAHGHFASITDHIVRNDPSQVLAQVAAIRAVIGLHKPTYGGALCVLCSVTDGSWPCTTLLELADGFSPGSRALGTEPTGATYWTARRG